MSLSFQRFRPVCIAWLSAVVLVASLPLQASAQQDTSPLPDPPPVASPETDESAASPQAANPESSAAKPEASAANPEASETAPSSAGAAQAPPVELPEGYREELQARLEFFRSKRNELEQAIGDQREIFIRYLNREQYSPERRQAYFDQRQRVRELLDETYLAALSVLQMGFDEPAATYLATMIQHRHEHDIYDVATMEGAARLLDGGSQLKYLYESAARSAVVCGEFEMAKKIYEAMPDSEQEDVDKRFEYNLDKYREQFEREAAIRQAEIEEDRLPRVLLKTTQGDVVVELFIDQAPSTVSHFIRLVEQGFYDGLDFFQVIDHLLALTGDPSGLGSGNSGQFLIDEHNRPDARKALRGSLVMAKLPMEEGKNNAFIPNTASSQFAILLMPILGASEEQTIFGTVIEGMDVISRLKRVDPHKDKKKGEILSPPDSILEAKVIRRPETLPEPQYAQPLLSLPQ